MLKETQIQIILFVTLTVLLSGCRAKRGEAVQYIDYAKEEIAGAVRIDVIEHSWSTDLSAIKIFEEHEYAKLTAFEYVEYGRITLTKNQELELFDIFKDMSARPKELFSGCIFEPHHSIEFYHDDGSKSVMLVCFQCDDTEWVGSPSVIPRDLQTDIKPFIGELGFSPTRDWVTLIKEEIEQSGVKE